MTASEDPLPEIILATLCPMTLPATLPAMLLAKFPSNDGPDDCGAGALALGSGVAGGFAWGAKRKRFKKYSGDLIGISTRSRRLTSSLGRSRRLTRRRCRSCGFSVDRATRRR